MSNYMKDFKVLAPKVFELCLKNQVKILIFMNI